MTEEPGVSPLSVANVGKKFSYNDASRVLSSIQANDKYSNYDISIQVVVIETLIVEDMYSAIKPCSSNGQTTPDSINNYTDYKRLLIQTN